ncbi:MAG: signal peptide peptidase SppA [Desulfobacterales bacterium]
MPKIVIRIASILIVMTVGCAAPQIKLFPSQADPLQESTLEGRAEQKILVIPVRGVISNSPDEGLVRTRPSVVQEVVSHLRKAAQDKEIRAVVLQINSPGGSVTGSDILYHEILRFKEERRIPVVAAMLDVAASGAYYIALPADHIVAHPTTLTGSVGVIFIRPKVAALMEKIGVAVEVSKSGVNKDIGSPFRHTTPEEERLLTAMTEQLGKRFVDLVNRHRQVEPAALAEVSTARVFLAEKALKFNLVDSIGYMPDALGEAKKRAGLPDDARVVVYRRLDYPNDNIYNPVTSYEGSRPTAVLDLGLPRLLPAAQTGFYYLWHTAAD